MKKFIITAPFVLLFSLFSFNLNLEAAGCRSHKSKKNLEVECSINNENCNNQKLSNKFTKVKS